MKREYGTFWHLKQEVYNDDHNSVDFYVFLFNFMHHLDFRHQKLNEIQLERSKCVHYRRVVVAVTGIALPFPLSLPVPHCRGHYRYRVAVAVTVADSGTALTSSQNPMTVNTSLQSIIR